MRNYFLILTYLTTMIESRLNSQLHTKFGCSPTDHAECDELCKVENYWYGNCVKWNGMDFQCRCFEYKLPLDGSVCKAMIDYCTRICQQKGSEGGYCYPQATFDNPRGKPTCSCFGKFMA